jgi:prophage tail gpP-like protein
VADVRLSVNGTEFAGWKKVRVERSVDSISGVFGLEVTDRWSSSGLRWVINPGSECILSVDGVALLTGYVDVVKASYDASTRSLQINGRDKAADMVDSSALNEPDSWTQVTIGKLASELAKPFGLTVKDQTGDATQFHLAKIQPGETAFEILERYSRQRGVLSISDGNGAIVLTKPGQKRADVALEQGKNILRADGTADYSQRFSEYLVTGQTAGTDEVFGTQASQIEGRARDSEIRNARRLLITAPNSTDAASMQKIAAWEAIVRAARGSPLTITVQDWYQTPRGRLWQPGEIVQVRSAWLQIDESADFLINAVKFSKSDGEGTLTELDLLRPDAYKPDPKLEAQTGTWGGFLDR